MLTNYRDFMEEHVKKYPTIPMFAYRDPDTGERAEVLPSDFRKQVMALSAYLLKEGYEHKHVGIFSPNSYKYILVRQALMCCGCTAVLLDVRMEDPELINLIKDSESCAIFCSEDVKSRAEEFSKNTGAAVLYMSKLDDYMKEGNALRDNGKFMAEDVEIDPDAGALILYTSGTTGRNKGVVHSQRSYLTAKVMEYEQDREATGDSVLVLPFTHVMSETSLLNTLLSGHTLFINQNTRRVFEDIKNERPEVLVLVPLYVQTLLDLLWKSIRDKGKENQIRKQIEENRKYDYTLKYRREMFAEELEILGGRLFKILSGGAKIAQRLVDEFRDFGIDVLDGIGTTETGGVLATYLYGQPRAGSVGSPMLGTEIRIDNPDVNGVGEVCVKGSHVMLGYYKKQEDTDEVLKDGWFHTGDSGRFDTDHFLYITGRIKNLIILSNGENVSPEELEQRIAKNPAVKEILVYGEGEDIVAEIYPDSEYHKVHGTGDLEGALKKYVLDLNEELSDYKRIHVIRFRTEPFEKTSSGKIKRRQ